MVRPTRVVSSLVLALAAVAALAVAACGPTRYSYAPVTTTSADIVGHPAAEYPFPPDTPHGRVRLATFGIAQLARDGARFFHVRMNATNDGTQTWSVEKSQQIVEIAAGDERQRKTHVHATTEADQSADHVEVTPGTTQTIDLFFPLPPALRDAAEIPAFEVIWSVREGSESFATATPFTRFLASGPAFSTPRAPPNYPYGDGVSPRRPPGPPDGRWPQPDAPPYQPPLPDAPIP